MLSIYKENDKFFEFTRYDADGEKITTVPQGLFFTVKRAYEEDSPIILKSIGNGIEQLEDGSWQVHIQPRDTEFRATGKYYCDVKVRNEDGLEFTIVQPQEFQILEVATKLVNEN